MTHWELGNNRRLHVPAACAVAELGGALKVTCAWSETESTRLQPSTLGSDRLRVRRERGLCACFGRHRACSAC